MRPISKRSEPSSTFARLLAVVARIPRGRVATYGQVARLAGLPGAARAVGWALAALPDDTIPWHRVINAQGGISPRDGEERQGLRLRREGVRPGRTGRYDLDRYGWDGTPAKRSRRSN
jgi:methylated-DNA-protein-cysteine methyltransferase-like protein